MVALARVVGQGGPVPSCNIGPAVAGDIEVLRDLFRRSSLSNDGDRENLLANPDVLAFSGVSVREGRTRVATDDTGRIVGFVTVAPAAGCIELEDLFVEPDAMRRGVGTALVLDAVAHARDRGVPRVEVTANHHALSFYQRVGFTFDRDVETRFGSAPRMVLRVTD